MAMVGLLTALPNTQLWRRLEKEERLLGESSGNNTDCTVNFITKMDRETLINGYRSILKTIYSPGEYYERAIASLKNTIAIDMPPLRSLTSDNFLSFCRLVFKLGIVDSGRKDFWQFTRRIFREHRGLLADAMALAAMGYHFRKVTEAYCSD
jgi:hypothetical protein